MVMQIRRTPVPNNPPTGLAEGQIAVEMATVPLRLWCGVPTTIDPSGVKLIVPSGTASGTTPPATGNAVGDLFYDTANNVLLTWNGTAWVPVGGGGTNPGPTAPASPNVGDLWFDTTAGQLMVWNGPTLGWSAVAAGSAMIDVFPKILLYGTAGTFTFDPAADIPPGSQWLDVYVVGAGGGGGGGFTTGSNVGYGGAAGGACRKILAVKSLTAAVTVTIGAHGLGGRAGDNTGRQFGTNGGASSFGTLLTASGGSGGSFGGGSAQPAVAGGVATGGDINIPGGWNGAIAGDLQNGMSAPGRPGFGFGTFIGAWAGTAGIPQGGIQGGADAGPQSNGYGTGGAPGQGVSATYAGNGADGCCLILTL